MSVCIIVGKWSISCIVVVDLRTAWRVIHHPHQQPGPPREPPGTLVHWFISHSAGLWRHYPTEDLTEFSNLIQEPGVVISGNLFEICIKQKVEVIRPWTSRWQGHGLGFHDHLRMVECGPEGQQLTLGYTDVYDNKVSTRVWSDSGKYWDTKDILWLS